MFYKLWFIWFFILPVRGFCQADDNYYLLKPPVDTTYDFSKPANNKYYDLEKNALGIWGDSTYNTYSLFKSRLFGKDTFELWNFDMDYNYNADTLWLESRYILVTNPKNPNNSFVSVGEFQNLYPQFYFLNTSKPYIKDEHFTSLKNLVHSKTVIMQEDSSSDYLKFQCLSLGYELQKQLPSIINAWCSYNLGDERLHFLKKSELFGRDTFEIWSYNSNWREQEITFYEKLFVKAVNISGELAFQTIVRFRSSRMTLTINPDSTCGITGWGNEGSIAKKIKVDFITYPLVLKKALQTEKERHLVGKWLSSGGFTSFKLFWKNNELFLDRGNDIIDKVKTSEHDRGVRIDIIKPKNSTPSLLPQFDRYSYYVLSPDLSTFYFPQNDFIRMLGFFQAHKTD
ncbi:MAG: hypothetical protein KA149_04010 [Chitinophagales bacterium]|nr:hypothetical protein [Chitinophagales bacterium]